MFVQNIPEGFTWTDLKDMFRESLPSPCGTSVAFASVSTGKNCGIVQFDEASCVPAAIDLGKSGGYTYNGSPVAVYVREDVQDRSRRRGGEGDDKNRVYGRERNSGGVRDRAAGVRYECATEGVEDILKEEEIDIVEEMVRARIQARGRRNFEAGDEIREELHTYYILYD